MKSATRCLVAVGGLATSILVAAACSSDDTSAGTPVADAGNGLVDSNAVLDSNIEIDGGLTDAGDAAPTTRIVYVESNSVAANSNSVLAYVQGADGSLTPLPGSPFMTGGTGVSNPQQALGPDDTDQQIMLSGDKTILYAVNAGSDTIAVFHVNDDGSLVAVTGSPFPSGGTMPVSIGLAADEIFVVNQAQDPLRVGVGTPNYVGIPVLANSTLGTPNPSTAAGKSPQLALVTPDAKLLFGVDFMAPLATGAGPLRAFAIGANGALTAAAGTPLALPAVAGGTPEGTPLALGLALHPAQSLLYAGFVLRKEVGVYSYDTTGALTYVTNVGVTGAAPCWIRFNAVGDRAYVTDTATNSVSVLDTSNPLAPTEKQNLVLADLGPTYDGGGTGSPTSQTYEEALAGDGKFLFVLSQNTNPDLGVTAGNVLHVLSIAADGTLTETVPDLKLSLGAGVRPQGIAVLR